MLFSALPDRQGLYDPENESDSCGVAMVTDIQGRRSHAIVADGLVALEHLEHRGAAGAEPNSGDGAGILIQLPVELLKRSSTSNSPDRDRTARNTFAAGICFLPQDAGRPRGRSRARRGHRQRGRAASPRVARGARRPRRRRSRRDGTGLHALHGAAVRLRARRQHRRHRPRPAGLPTAQTRRSATACTSRRCPAAPWSTRACSRQCSCPNTSRTCATNAA